MSSNDPAYQLALQKNQARLARTRQDFSGSNDRLTHIQEELTHWKNKLANTADTTTKNQLVDRLLALRAEQASLLLTALHNSNTEVQTEQKTTAIITAYYADCARLLAAVNHQPHGGRN